MPAHAKEKGPRIISTVRIPRNEFFAFSEKDKALLYDLAGAREERADGRKAPLKEIQDNLDGASGVSFYIAQGIHRLPRMFYSVGDPKFFPDNNVCGMLNVVYRDNLLRMSPGGPLEHSELSLRAENDIIGIPLMNGKEKLGMIVVEGHEDKHFSLKGRTEMPFITRYLSDIANSYKDMMNGWFSPVTGLLARSAYESEIRPSMAKWLDPASEHSKYNFAVLSVDLDRFKAINDTFGHQAGDRVLCTAADVMLKNTRNAAMYKGAIRSYTDWVVQWGGDEFLIVLQNAGILEAQIVAERLRVALSNVGHEGEHIKKKTNASRTISASIGILTSDIIRRAMAHDQDFDFSKLLDRIVYMSKGPRNAVSYMHGGDIVTVRGGKTVKNTPYREAKQA